MNFQLTPQMVDKIAFAMEDQKQKFAADVESGELVPITSPEALPEEKYVRLPRWGSAEGFHLMESFVTSLDNPAYREQLRPMARRFPWVALRKSPGWGEMTFLNGMRQSERFTRREWMLAWVFATLQRQHGFALGLARESLDPLRCRPAA